MTTTLERPTSLQVFDNLEQGADEWLAARCGIVTASVVGQLITPKTIKPASNDYSRALTLSLVAERITGRSEPSPTSRAMERGNLDEPLARDHYAEHYAPVDQLGFMVRDFGGYKVGYSPDGLVGDDGAIEIKSRAPKIQLETVLSDEVPLANYAQLQAGLLVSGREWIDYLSWCGGMPMWRKRVLPDKRWFDAIKAAVERFEETATAMVNAYAAATNGLPATEYVDHFADWDILV